ncbi:hypothetical protein GCM10010464_30940 [Pseudonocardia yunnanensis]
MAPASDGWQPLFQVLLVVVRRGRVDRIFGMPRWVTQEDRGYDGEEVDHLFLPRLTRSRSYYAEAPADGRSRTRPHGLESKRNCTHVRRPCHMLARCGPSTLRATLAATRVPDTVVVGIPVGNLVCREEFAAVPATVGVEESTARRFSS